MGILERALTMSYRSAVMLEAKAGNGGRARAASYALFGQQPVLYQGGYLNVFPRMDLWWFFLDPVVTIFGLDVYQRGWRKVRDG